LAKELSEKIDNLDLTLYKNYFQTNNIKTVSNIDKTTRPQNTDNGRSKS